jgi:hypothetical protein
VSEEIRIFVGYDPREAVAYHTCCQSIIEGTKAQVSFTPIRGERRDGSNDFIYARFLVPYLCGYRGRAIFLDGDMIVRGDIAELAEMDTSYVGARVVKHDYLTKFPVKYLGNKNENYPRKNWSSVILWNCSFFPNRNLTPEFVAKQPGSFLHRFSWLTDEQIGELPNEWNRLVLEEPMTSGDKIRHYTIGTPCFDEYSASDPEWWSVFNRMKAPA